MRGVDCFTPYYEEERKRSHLTFLGTWSTFELVEADLRTADLGALFDGVDTVFHLAGQPGLRLSWSTGFGVYAEQNIVVTQRLLEAAKDVQVSRSTATGWRRCYHGRADGPGG